MNEHTKKIKCTTKEYKKHLLKFLEYNPNVSIVELAKLIHKPTARLTKMLKEQD